MLYFDYVALAVRDLGAADRLLRNRFGLGTIEGGRHPLWGTANRIVPLGPHFIEVVGITDAEIAADNPVGRYVLSQTADANRFIGVCLGTHDKAALTARLDLHWVEGERNTAAGRLSFRSAGIDRAIQEGGGFPYFFEYDDAGLRTGRGDPGHAVEPVRIEGAKLQHDPVRLREYLGEDIAELNVTPGIPEFVSLTIATKNGPLVLPGVLER